MKTIFWLSPIVTFLVLSGWSHLGIHSSDPPYSGTIFIGPEIVKDDDPTTFVSLDSKGQGNRKMFDRRTDRRDVLNAHLFDATFKDGKIIEFQVNPEFGAASAYDHAQTYAKAVGQLPSVLLMKVETVMIHGGKYLFGGGNKSLLIHTAQGDEYMAMRILEETLIHEACHTSLDKDHAKSTDWIKAQQNDPVFISTYARDNPEREDIAESFLLYLAVRYRPERISVSMKDSILSAIPHRLEYLDSQNFDIYPFSE